MFWLAFFLIIIHFISNLKITSSQFLIESNICFKSTKNTILIKTCLLMSNSYALSLWTVKNILKENVGEQAFISVLFVRNSHVFKQQLICIIYNW